MDGGRQGLRGCPANRLAPVRPSPFPASCPLQPSTDSPLCCSCSCRPGPHKTPTSAQRAASNSRPPAVPVAASPRESEQRRLRVSRRRGAQGLWARRSVPRRCPLSAAEVSANLQPEGTLSCTFLPTRTVASLLNSPRQEALVTATLGDCCLFCGNARSVLLGTSARPVLCGQPQHLGRSTEGPAGHLPQPEGPGSTGLIADVGWVHLFVSIDGS